jgi:hypothetical protein
MRETRTTFSVRNQSRMDTLMRGAAPLEAVGPIRLQSLDLLRAIKILLERAIEENADKRSSSYEKIESAGFRSESKPQLDLGSRQTRVILEKLLEAKEADRLSPRYLQLSAGTRVLVSALECSNVTLQTGHAHDRHDGPLPRYRCESHIARDFFVRNGRFAAPGRSISSTSTGADMGLSMGNGSKTRDKEAQMGL